MTTQGVHRYVLGILRELGLREEDITKVQTGGPDGDLGSNEILISRDRTIAVVDGGGVIWDPDGLDRVELARLASAGLDSSGFDAAHLGPKGFAVRVGDRDKRLPDGTVVASGTGFRNSFHLDPRFRADLFVPCGGRPKSINLANWRSLLDAEGRPAFRWIVEGANLFITQEARLKLEEKGITVFKDSSTNKGGVISSSLEVLGALAMDDASYARLLCASVKDGEPDFRRRYIGEVVRHIVSRGDLEFALLWKTHRETGRPFSVLAEEVSARINQITDEVAASSLVDDPAMRRAALRLQAPAMLVDAVGAQTMIERLPPAYQRALVATAVASTFVYRFGLSAGFEEYRRYVAELASGTTPS
jgi:glutamate dehydrogenase